MGVWRPAGTVVGLIGEADFVDAVGVADVDALSGSAAHREDDAGAVIGPSADLMSHDSRQFH